MSPVRDFMAEYSGLVIASEDGRRVLRLDGHEAARNADLDWCAAYAEGIGRALTPVREYSHMTLLIDETGVFWGGLDGYYGFLGEDIVEAVQACRAGIATTRPASRQLTRHHPRDAP